MARRTMCRGLFVIACWLCVAATGAANDARQAYESARQLMAAGDLAAARQSLVAALKLDGDNQRYLQQYLMVTQAIKFEQAMAGERDQRRWELAAQSLSLFYKTQDLHRRALPIDAAIYERLKSTEAAVQYCETLLELNQPERVVEVLRGLGSGQTTPSSEAFLGIALAHQGKLDEARRVVDRLRLPAETDSFTLYVSARAQAAVGAEPEALATLRRCYESVPPSRLDPLKSHTKQCSEFAAMAASPTFSQVLRTQSKVPESKCSGGSSCGSCPLRGKCSHDQ